MHLAALKGHSEVCRLIIENVEDKNPADNFGDTPLHLAAKKGSLDICKMILPKVKDKNPVSRVNRKTPLDLARLGGFEDVILLFEENAVNCLSNNFDQIL